MINTLGIKQRFVKQFEKWRFVRICVVKISHRKKDEKHNNKQNGAKNRKQ